MRNPYKVVPFGVTEDGKKIYGVEYIDHPYIGIPDSWGTKRHAVEYMAALLGMTYAQFMEARKKFKRG